jgi:hypothetical protein
MCERRKRKPQISPLRYAPVEMTILYGCSIPRFQERYGKPQIPSLGMTKRNGEGSVEMVVGPKAFSSAWIGRCPLKVRKSAVGRGICSAADRSWER